MNHLKSFEMMMFLCAVRVIFNDTNWDEYHNGSVPILCMCFMPNCGYCRRALPGFDAFADSFKEREDFVVGMLNCSQYRHFCVFRLSVRSYPTFTVNTEKYGLVKPQIRANKQMYNEVIERTLALEAGTLLKPLDGNPQFPVAVFRLNPNDKANIDIAESAAYRSSYIQKLHFAIEYDELILDPEVILRLSNDFSVKMDLEFTEPNITQFCQQNGYLLLGNDWNFMLLTNMNKLFMCIVPDSRTDFRLFETLAKEVHKDAIMGTTGDNFNVNDAIMAFELDKKEFPYAVIVNGSSKSYAKLGKIDVEKARSFLTRALNHDDSLEFHPIRKLPDVSIFMEVLAVVAKILIALAVIAMIIGIGVGINYYYRKTVGATTKLE